ncbi:lipoprotein signal peptidase [Clostridia bacterium]|nr:lipoprotein signal peptidase [Clostridia bacterium]
MDSKKTKTFILKFPIFDAIILALTLAIDLLSKHFIAKYNTNSPVLGELVRFDYVKNTGAAFSFLGDKAWAPTFFIVLAALIIPAIGAFLYFSRKNGIVCRLALTLIISGALGNWLDRVFLGYVRDFIAVSFFPPIFNGADSWLTIGIVLFLIYYIFLYKDPKKSAK